MAEVQVRVNGRVYAVGCEDGQEQHVLQLAAVFEEQVAQVARQVGQLGETRLFLLGALLLADELAEAKARLVSAGADLSQLSADRARLEGRTVELLERAAETIEQLAAKAG
jgi:cell division protein ZapA